METSRLAQDIYFTDLYPRAGYDIMTDIYTYWPSGQRASSWAIRWSRIYIKPTARQRSITVILAKNNSTLCP